MEVECMCSSTHKQRGVLMMTVWRCKKNYNNSPNSFEMKNGKCENSNYRFVQMLEVNIFFFLALPFMIFLFCAFWARSTWDPPALYKGDSSREELALLHRVEIFKVF